MARLGRYFLSGQALHVIQRGNNRQVIFFHDEDRALYCSWLGEAAAQYGCAIHAYVLMTNHVHLLVTPQSAESLPRTMQSLGRHYVRRINDTYGRTGTLWEGRYRAAPIDGEGWFMTCSRYIELNPVRARFVAHPRLWRWSSYRANAEGASNPLVTPHPLYRALARSHADRLLAYRRLFKDALSEEALESIRMATNGGWALGNDRFRQEIESSLKRRAAPLPRGRPPKKKPSTARQINLL